MLFPKKVKHRKWFTMRQHPVKEAAHADTRGIKLAFGSFGLKAMEYARVTSNQIEAARKVTMHHAGKTGKVWIRVFPDKPVTKKPAETRMGKGKGAPDHWVAVVRPGKLLFEMEGVSVSDAQEAMRLASHKLPLTTKFVKREVLAH